MSYVGGYQGAPVSHLLDVMVQARDYLDDLGVHVEACTSEASAAAMLGASINYPARGAVTWKSVVGTNVAADALSYLASAGVMGGTLIVLGEDYGEGGVVAQERSHSFAMKSLIWLLDPRLDLAHMVRMVGEAFALSEASSMPAMLELHPRMPHARQLCLPGQRRAGVFVQLPIEQPAAFDYDRLSHPPSTFAQEKKKHRERIPAARRLIVERRLNETSAGTRDDIGIIMPGGLSNSLIRALQQFGLAAFGASEILLC